MKTTLDLDGELLEGAKQLAAKRRSTLTAVVENALREALIAAEHTPEYRLEMPTAGSDQSPAVDPAHRDALYDLMEGRSE